MLGKTSICETILTSSVYSEHCPLPAGEEIERNEIHTQIVTHIAGFLQVDHRQAVGNDGQMFGKQSQIAEQHGSRCP